MAAVAVPGRGSRTSGGIECSRSLNPHNVVEGLALAQVLGERDGPRLEGVAEPDSPMVVESPLGVPAASAGCNDHDGEHHLGTVPGDRDLVVSSESFDGEHRAPVTVERVRNDPGRERPRDHAR